MIDLTNVAKSLRKRCRKLQGQPVCVVLQDGSYYVGWLAGIEHNEIVLSGRKGAGKLSRTAVKQAEKALVSGLLPGWTGSSAVAPANPFGFQAGGAFPFNNQAGFGLPGGNQAQGGPGATGGIFDTIGKWWPKIRMGIGIVQTIMPLLTGLKL